jgi:hypothetical protein
VAFHAAFLHNIKRRGEKCLAILHNCDFLQAQQRLAALLPQSRLSSPRYIYPAGFSF